METKACTKCNRILPIDDFNWRDKQRGVRRSECKYCHCEFMKKAYETKQAEVAKLKATLSCKKCGERKEYKLDFHHKDPSKKETTVARMISNNYRIDKILDEIKKCVVLCAGCHREFHYYNNRYGIELNDYLENDYDFD